MKALILFSGGLDSTTLLAVVIEKYGKENVVALSISYGQKHTKEVEAAKAVADYYGVELQSIDLAEIFRNSDSALLSHSEKEIPTGSYDRQKMQEDKLISTYVPFRNGLFLSVAASVGLSNDCTHVYYGAHHDDWAGSAYPDCSPEFVEAMKASIAQGTGGALQLEAPFVHWNKADIVKTGLELAAPYELTWSCYEGGDEPCHLCATCVDRERGFRENGVVDPLIKEKEQ